MISIVVPTRNRAHTISIVAASYFQQALVDEIIFVDDAGSDDIDSILRAIQRDHPQVSLKILRNTSRRGASQSRNVGVLEARNEYILFVDDDEYLEKDYATVCLQKLHASGAGAISGRRVYMLEGETPQQALVRFGTGLRRTKAFRPIICEVVNGARFTGDINLPFTNAIILTKRSLLLQYPFDGAYAQGNGYREETDYQMNLFVHGYKITVTNAVHSIHLPNVRAGGQRTSKWRKIFWGIYYTDYFYKKYYNRYAAKMGLRTPRIVALCAFAIFMAYKELLRPHLYAVAIRMVGHQA